MSTSRAPELTVLDSWPLLEWLKGRQPGHKNFVSLVQEAKSGHILFHMSRINYGEVIYSVRKAPELPNRADALQKLHAAPIFLHSVEDTSVDEAVELKSRYPIAYADAFAAALAMRLGAPLATGDAEFRRLEADGLIQLRWMGA